MANLGNIWFNLGAKDNTDKDLEKIIKKIENKEVKLSLGLSEGGVTDALKDALKEISKEQEKIDSSNKSSSESSKEQEKSAIALLRNEEKILRAKERIEQLVRRISLTQYDNTEEMRNAYMWAKQTSEELSKIALDDDATIIEKTGADLSATINKHIHELNRLKKADKEAKQQLSKDGSDKAYKRSVDDAERLERALLRVQKVQDRIKHDPFRMQEGYKEVYAQIDKIRKSLEKLRGSSSRDIKLGTGTALAKQIQEVEVMIAKQDQLYRDTTKQTTHMTRMWGQVGSQIKSALSIYAVQSFVRQLITMGGEFEKQHYALRAIIGDLGKADQIFNNLRQVAVKSPFHFGDFTGFAKQLAAFSIPVNEIYDTTKRLADVSAGLGVDMGRIILAYGQIRAASFLRGQEVRQLTEAGIPIIEELAKKLTELKGVVVSTGEVFDSISRREVPFEMVKEVFQDLTDEGGKFYNMQEKLAESLSGKWANLTSYFQLMLYDISQEQNGALHALIETLTYLTKNFKLVQSAIYGMVTAFATAKVMHWVSAFGSMNMEAKRLLVTIRQLGRAILSTKGLMTAGAGLLTGILSYAYSKKAEYDKAVNDIISTSYELENSISSNMKAFIELTKKEGESAEVSAERHKILLDIAKTEPEVAKEIRAHANNTAFLTTKLKEYVAAQRAARDAELGFAGDSWFADTMEDTENKVKRVEDDIARLNINARKSFADLMRTLEGRELGEYMTDRYGSVWSEEIIMNLNKVLNDVNKTAEDKWREFNEIAYKYIKDVSGAGAASVFYQRISAFEYVQKKYADVSKTYADRIAEASVTISQSLENTLKQSNIKEGSEEYKRVAYEAINNMTSVSDKAKSALYEAFSIDPSIYEENTRALGGWKDELDKILNGIVTITKDTSVEDAISSVTSALKSTKEYISGIDEAKLRHAIDTQAKGWIVAEASLKELTKSKEDVKALNKAMEFLGVIEKMSGTKTKDAFADKMEQRVKLIKDANSMYEKYIALLGRADALERVRSDKRFTGLDFDPDNIESMLSDIYNQLNNSEAQKKVKDVITSMYTDIDFDKVKDSVNKMADGIKKLIKENADKFKLFDSIMDTTGNEALAKEMAFGGEDFGKSYADFLKGILSDEVGAENVAKMLGLDADLLRDNYSEPIIKLVEDINNETDKLRSESVNRQMEAIKATATLQEQADAIRLRYERDISNAVNERASEALTESMQKELADLYSQAIQLTPIWRELFVDSSEYGSIRLQELNNRAKEMLGNFEEERDLSGELTGNYSLLTAEGKKLTVTAEVYQRLLRKINEQNKKLNEQNPFRKMGEALGKLFSGSKEGERKNVLADIEELGKSLQESADYIRGLGDDLGTLFGEGVGESVEEIAELTEGVGQLGSGIAQLASGDIISGLSNTIGGLAKLKNLFSGGKEEHRAALKELERQRVAIEHNYSLALRTVGMELKKTVFGTSSWNHMSESAEAYRKTLGRVQKGIKDLDKVEIVVGSKRRKRFLKKKQLDVYGDILKAYPELVKNDKLDIELAKTLLNEKKFRKEGKETLEMLIEEAEMLEEALKNVSDVLSEIFGALGQDITNAFVSAFKNGTDAMADIHKSATKMLEDLTTQFIVSATIAPLMDKYSDMVKDLMVSNNQSEVKLEGMYDILNLFLEETAGMGDFVNKLLKEAQDMAKDKGYDIYQPDDIESNLGKGIQSLTEDTAQLLGSYLNAIRQDVSVNRDVIDSILSSIGTSLSTDIGEALATLKKIEANTLRNANAVDEINTKLEQVMNGARRFSTE